MAEAATRRMSAVRERHAVQPVRPVPASKPGEPSTAGAPRRRSGQSNGTSGRSGGSSKPERAGGSGKPQRAGGSANPGREAKPEGEKGKLPSLTSGREISLPGGREISLPGGGDFSLPHPHLSIWARLALKIAKRLARHELRQLAKFAGAPLGGVASQALAKPARDALAKPAREALAKPAREALAKPVREVLTKPLELDVSAMRPGLPVQRSTDIAVPLEFAWKKWMELSFLPEGVDQVVDIERNGDELSGRLTGDESGSWAARVLDERECESFAWQSTEGSDCAGLVTFHRLSDRLTRIELSLDVVPQSPVEAAALLVHLADWRAARQLRRFKAELEVISPDVYADDEDSSSR